MINNSPRKLLFINSFSAYTMFYFQHSTYIDQDIKGKVIWYTPSGGSEVRIVEERLDYVINNTYYTLMGLNSSTNYNLKAAFYDQMIDSQLLDYKVGMEISDNLSFITKTPPSISAVNVTATSVEVGVSNPTVTFSLSGQAEIIEIYGKLSGASTWSIIYTGTFQASIPLILPVGTWEFSVRGSYTMPDGVNIDRSNLNIYGVPVVVEFLTIPPSKPGVPTFKVAKIKDGIERFDVQVAWDWSRLSGPQVKEFVLEYITTSKYDSNPSNNKWLGSSKINTGASQNAIINNFPFNVPYYFRVTVGSWGVEGSNKTISDNSWFAINSNTVLDQSFINQTGVDVSYSGITAYTVVAGTYTQTFKIDAANGNVIIGRLDGLGNAPFVFDAINNILNIDGKVITKSINSANFILTNLQGSSPALYSQEKPYYGNPNSGIWMGYNSSGAFTMDIGNSAQYMRWDGSALRISGNVVVGTPSGDTSLNDALQGKLIVYVYKLASSIPSQPTEVSYPPSGWQKTPPAKVYGYNIYVCQGIIDPISGNVLQTGQSWSIPVQWSGDVGTSGTNGTNGTNGTDGVSSFKSVVFLRSINQPSTPSGGNYGSPVPSGWYDGIPDGVYQLWSSTRVFTNTGGSPQQAGWTTPVRMTDTSTTEFMYSSVVDNPGDPLNTPWNWSSASNSSTIWMATRVSTNGVWSNWSVLKVKGETGSKGDTGSTGAQGIRGPGMYSQAVANLTAFDSTQAANFFAANFNSGPVKYDVLSQYRASDPSISFTLMWNGSIWTTPAMVVHGDMIVSGTVRAEALVGGYAFFQQAGINVIYDNTAAVSGNPEATYKMKIDLANGFIHIR